MTQDTVMHLATQTMWMTVLIGAPLLLSALAVGLLVSAALAGCAEKHQPVAEQSRRVGSPPHANH